MTPFECETLTELTRVLKEQTDVTILTKQPSVVERFCEENSITTAKIFEWKLGGPSFTIKKKEERRNNKVRSIGSETNLGNPGNIANPVNSEVQNFKLIITDEVL